MIRFTQGNLLEAPVEALVNTVNTVGVMGKGIALMFKERFPENFRQYAAACKAGQVQTGAMFVTETRELDAPRWIVNFPTKQDWRAPSKLEWIVAGLADLRRFLIEQQVQSVAIPPLGAGNGGLDWPVVREQIERALGDLALEILVYEPTPQYQNVAKRAGVEALTPPRALIAELVRRYWVLGMECSLLEIQKLAWFLEQALKRIRPDEDVLKLQFTPHIYGPYAQRLTHLLNRLDGSYLHCEKRISDARPFDLIWFDESHKPFLRTYLQTEVPQPYQEALAETIALMDGFESPFGMELLATVSWLLTREGVAPTVPAVREGLRRWPVAKAVPRKLHLFDERVIDIALKRLTAQPQNQSVQTSAQRQDQQPLPTF